MFALARVIRMISVLALVITIAFSPSSVRADEKESYTSSNVCGACHVEIFESWRKSLHALSYNNQVFLTAYREAYLETNGSAKYFCLKCHAPTYLVTGDVDAAYPITREGVTCDFCHTIVGVDVTNTESPFKLDVGGAKHSSLKNAKSEAHSTSYADWFNKSEMCGACHEVTNMNGVRTGSTYSEWKSSSYAADGVQCQHCHMAPVPGNVVDPSVQDSSKNVFHEHSLSHNMDQMKNAIKVEIVGKEKMADGRYIVDVAITNKKAGHNIPTGSPSRKLALEVRLSGENYTESVQLKKFGKDIVDKSGNALTMDGEVMMRGAKVTGNSSLKPKERRVERFMFSAAPRGEVKVSARAFLIYRHVVTVEESTLIQMGSAVK